MPEAKAYVIPKQLVWDAYQRVKANRGAAGADGESLVAFETDLKNNLYKVWNRMSSGSYFPPPVRLVEIEKESGGTRPLGIFIDQRRILAGARHRHAARVDPLCGKLAHHRLGTALTELTIVLFAAHRIGMAFDDDGDIVFFFQALRR